MNPMRKIMHKPIATLIKGKENLKDFSPEKSFVELPAFKAVLWSTITLSIVVTMLILLNSNLSPDYSYKGFNKATEFFRVPLGLLAIMIPIIALIATNHRSVQTKEQIKLSEQQNKFSNHFKHIDEFEKYCSAHEEHSKFSIRRKRRLHYSLFPRSREGDHRIATLAEDDLRTIMHSFSKKFRQFAEKNADLEKTSDELFINEMKIFCNTELKQAHDSFQMAYKENTISCEKSLALKTTKIAAALLVAREVKETLFFISELFQFDESYLSLAQVGRMKNNKFLASENSAQDDIAYFLGYIDGHLAQYEI